MSYPLPGETVIDTRRNIDFGGGGYGPDEPAPDDVAVIWRAVKVAERNKNQARDKWEHAGDTDRYVAYLTMLDEWEKVYNQLLRVMRNHRYKTFVVDGCRIRYVTERNGSRKSYVDVQEIAK